MDKVGLYVTGYQSDILVLSGVHDVTISDSWMDTTAQLNSVYGVVLGAGSATAARPYTITLTGNRFFSANGSQFWVNWGADNVTDSGNLIS